MTEYDRAQIQKWCKFARGVTATKKMGGGGIKQGLGVFLKMYIITYVYCPLLLRYKKHFYDTLVITEFI